MNANLLKAANRLRERADVENLKAGGPYAPGTSIYVDTLGQKVDINGGEWVNFPEQADTVKQPTVRIARVSNLRYASGDGDGCEIGSALMAIHWAGGVGEGDPSEDSSIQSVGIFGGAANYSQNSNIDNPTGGADAVGIYGVGLIYPNGIGVGVGGFFIGTRQTLLGSANAVQLAVNNDYPHAEPYYPLGFSKLSGVWLCPLGQEDSSAGVILGNAFGRQFEVGYAVNGQVTGGKTGAVSGQSFRDDGNAVTSFDINGSHTNGIDTVGATFSGDAILMAAGQSAKIGLLKLIPMTKSARNLLAPAAGMLVSQSDNTPGLRYYNGSHRVRYTETNDD